MTNESNSYVFTDRRNIKKGGVSSGIYGLAFLGALVYYLQHAATFGAGALGVVKALFWPAVLVYNIMEYLKM